MKHILTSLGLLSLTGCANLSFNTGYVDWRRADNISETTLANEMKENKSCIDNISTKNHICKKIAPAQLSAKIYSSNQSPIRTNDFYSIYLDYGNIAYISELPFFTINNHLPKLKRIGEIAILVNAFEFGLDNENNRFYELGASVNSTDKDNSSPPLPDYSSAKVVYFNPDVHEKQGLNFHQIPIIASKKYNGGPIGLQIIVLDFDKLSDSTKSLLTSIADLGRTYVTPGPVNDALFKLGTSLVNSSSDDILFEYRMVLTPQIIGNNAPNSTFTSGRYVFRRTENRNAEFIWSNLILDQNTGQLLVVNNKLQNQSYNLRKDSDNNPIKISDYTSYKEETYFTINVLNEGKNAKSNNYEFNTWKNLQTKIDAFLKADTIDTTDLTNVINEAKNKRISLNNYSDLKSQYTELLYEWKKLSISEVITMSNNGYEKFSDYKNLENNECKSQWEYLYNNFSHSHNSIRANSRISLINFKDSIIKKVDEKKLDNSDANELVNGFWLLSNQFFTKKSDKLQSIENNFTDFQSFSKAYSNNAILLKDFETIIEENKIDSCDSLNANKI